MNNSRINILTTLFFISIIGSNYTYDLSGKISTIRNNSSKLEKISPFIILGIKGVQLNKAFSEIEKAPDMPQQIINWCESVYKKYNISITNPLKYKIYREGEICMLWAAVGKTYIALDPMLVDEVSNALKTPQEEESQKALNVHEFFLLHEIGHIKSNDCIKRILFPIATSIANTSLINYFKNPILDKIDNKNLKKSALSFCVIVISNMLKSYLYEAANINYMRYQESEADKFAISKINNPEQIDSIILYMQRFKDDLKQLIQYPEIIINNSNLNIIIRMNFKNSYALAKLMHTISKSKVPFVDWLEQNPVWLRSIHKSYDPTHPMAIDRIQILEKRKQELIKK